MAHLDPGCLGFQVLARKRMLGSDRTDCGTWRSEMQSTQVYAITREPGPGALDARTTDIPAPGAGQVRVRVETAGVSYGDLLFQRGVVPGGPKIPFVPGCDLTG